MNHNALSPFAFLALLSLASAAQNPPIFIGDQIGAPSPVATPRFGRSLALEVNGDFVPDVALLLEDQPYIIVGGVFYALWIPVPAVVHDMDVCPSPVEPFDSLVTVGPAGLMRWWLEAGDAAPRSEVLGDDAWKSARSVRATDIDGAGGTDFVGLASDGQTVLWRSFGAGSSTQGGQFTAATNVLAFELVQWDADEHPEVALVSATALTVRDLDGFLLGELAASAPASAAELCVLAGESTDRIAWVWTDAGGATQTLRVVSPGCAPGLCAESTVPLGSALGAVGTASADYDLDGDPDLFVTHRQNHLQVVFAHRGSAAEPHPAGAYTAFDPYVVLLWTASDDPYAPDEATSAEPLMADLDGDRDCDFFTGVEDEERALMIFNPVVDERALQTPILDAYLYEVSASTEYPLVIHVAIADEEERDTANALHALVWKQDNIGVPAVDVYPVADVLVPLAEAEWVPDSGGKLRLAVHVPITLPETTEAFVNDYHFQFRLVEADGAQIVHGFTPWFATFAGDPARVPPMQAAFGTEDLPLYTLSGDGNPKIGGGFVPRPALPIFPATPPSN